MKLEEPKEPAAELIEKAHNDKKSPITIEVP